MSHFNFLSEINLSIIIPVYNVEKYIRKCIESILSQSFENWELLLIDDGSQDNSGSICDEYQQKDKRIKVYHKTNGGVSSARNFGIRKASCSWITFIDADDFISSEYLKGLTLPILSNPDLDIIMGGCTNWSEGKVVGINQSYENYIGNQPNIIFNKFRGLVVSKLFRRDIIVKGIDGNPIEFDEKMKIAEDMAFTLDYLLTVKKYAFVSEVGYFYRKDNQNSATKKIKVQAYPENLYGWKHIWKSANKYVYCNHLVNQDIIDRLSVLANILYSTICSIRKLPLSCQTKVYMLTNDFSDEEIQILSYSSKSFVNYILTSCLFKKQYNLMILLLPLIRLEGYFNAFRYKLFKLSRFFDRKKCHQ